jgi:hypothetical protein
MGVVSSTTELASNTLKKKEHGIDFEQITSRELLVH